MSETFKNLIGESFTDLSTNEWSFEKSSRQILQGFEKMSKIFAGLAKVEKEHHDNYQRTLESLDNANKSEFSESNEYLEKAPK